MRKEYMNTDLSTYDNSWYNPGKNALLRFIWYFANALFLKSALFPISGLNMIPVFLSSTRESWRT